MKNPKVSEVNAELVGWLDKRCVGRLAPERFDRPSTVLSEFGTVGLTWSFAWASETRLTVTWRLDPDRMKAAKKKAPVFPEVQVSWSASTYGSAAAASIGALHAEVGLLACEIEAFLAQFKEVEGD